MKRWQIVACGIALGLAVFFLTGVASNFSTAFLERVQDWSAEQRFKGGATVQSATFASKVDYTLATPTIAPQSPTTTANSGACTTANTYRFYKAWLNQGGVSAIGPATADFVPSTTSKTTLLTNSETPPANATAYAFLFSRATDGHATKRLCSGPGLYQIGTGTTTGECNCNTINQNITLLPVAGNRTLASFGPDGDLSIGFEDASTPQLFLTEAKNRLRWNLAMPQWSNNSGSTFAPFYMSPGAVVVQVCPVGCQFSTLTAALASITDASVNKPYVIAAGAITESTRLDWKAFVSLSGISPDVTTVGEIDIPFDADGVTLANVHLNATIPVQINNGTPGARTHLTMRNFRCGADTFASTDCVFTQGSLHDIVMIDGLIQGDWDTVILGPQCREWDFNCRWKLDDLGFANQTPHGWEWEQSQMLGVEIHSYNANFDVNLSGTSSAFRALHVKETSGSPTNGTFVELVNPSIRVTATAASGTTTAKCFQFDDAVASSYSNLVKIVNPLCYMRGGAAGAFTAVDVSTSDADHATWTVDVQNGAFDLAGGASRTDVNNVDNTSGFSVNLLNVKRSNVLTGTGRTYTVSDIPAAACSTKCNAGNFCVNTSPALCFCTAADTWTKVSGAGACP